ncbi:hypothetical protein RB599_006490 [Gaeumannomyces hyphopodioides]
MRISLPSALASHCRSLLSRPAAASTATRFISTTAPKAVLPSTSSAPFSPAQLLDDLDRPSPSSSSPGGGGGGLRSNSNFWSSGGNRGRRNNPAPNRDPAADALASMLAETSTREANQALRTAQTRADASASLRKEDQSNSYIRQMPRRWTAGEVYSPHDLSPEEIKRYFRRELKPRFDVFDVLGFNPLDNYAPPPTELLRHLRVYNAHGPHKAPRRDGPAPRQPQEDGQGHQESHRSWPAPQCAPAPRNHSSPEEEWVGAQQQV